MAGRPAGHFEDLRCGIELWRAGKAMAVVAVMSQTLSTVSRPTAMLDEETTPSSRWFRGGQEFNDEWRAQGEGNEVDGVGDGLLC